MNTLQKQVVMECNNCQSDNKATFLQSGELHSCAIHPNRMLTN